MSEASSRPDPVTGAGPTGAQAAGPSADAGTSQSPSSASTPSPAASSSSRDPLRGSRASGIWAAVVALVVLLILLSVFILQNTQRVEITYFGWEGEAPLAASLLIAVAAGLLIAVIAGSLRILQLRRRVRREQKR
jgi:uncharacterized integral membrane protein